jgi:hypothetical protein
MRDNRNEAVEVFRQFAWNLVGRLVVPGGQRRRPPRSQAPQGPRR